MASPKSILATRPREWLALAVTAISFAALVAAGFVSNGDPDLAGRTTLARMAGEVARAVVAEWERLRQDPALFEGQTIEWALEPGPRFAPAKVLPDADGPSVALALFSEARRVERQDGDSKHALELVLQALEKHPGARCRGRSRLYAIQLAARTETPEVASEQWALAQEELAPDETLTDTSLLLLCALAAGPSLSLEGRAGARDRSVELWISGALALPRSTFEGSPLREAYRERLQALLPEASPDPRLARSALAERSFDLREELGAAHQPAPLTGLGVLAYGGFELIQHRLDNNTLEGRLLSPGTVAGWIESALNAAQLLPEGFTLDFEGQREEAGPVVRERVDLAFAPSGFVLRHSDPDSIISAVGRRGALLRAGFFALALGVAGAGFSVFRALRRESLLAELKSTFVASVSHELRTPVASILLMAENLEHQRVNDSEAQQRYFHLIRREAERLRQLVDDVLDFSRIERGKGVHLVFTELQVTDFARELESGVRERVEELNGEWTLHCEQLPSSARLDSDALRRAVLNLVDNALRHSGERCLELTLTGDGASGFVIAVRDRGRGVPASRLDSMFRPFERLERDQNSLVAGTGLGLAIVREIAEGHGGRAIARLPNGPGLVVELHLPGTPDQETS